MKFTVRSISDDNKAVHAIKAIRNFSGLGLKEAKDIVDAIKAGHVEHVIPSNGTSNEHEFVADMREAGYYIGYNCLEQHLFNGAKIALEEHQIDLCLDILNLVKKYGLA